MREKQIKVLMVKALEEPRETVLQNDLDSLQKAVSIEADYQGLIEIIGIDDDMCILCNEEGKLNGLPLNRPLRDDEGNIYDIIAGVFYVTGEDDDGNLTSLSPEMMDGYIIESLCAGPEGAYYYIPHFTSGQYEKALSDYNFSVVLFGQIFGRISRKC